jgi:hypothetical protein
MNEGDDGCSSHSPIEPSIELGRSIISVTKRNFDKENLNLSIRGLSISTLKNRASCPLNPFLCNYENVDVFA